MFSLNDQCALITGASGGIGGAIAETLHRAGATVALSGRQTARLEECAKTISPKGERVHILPSPLGNPEQVKALAETAETAMGRLDILVNNAGITRDSLALRMKDEDWNEVLQVNLTAAFLLTRAALRGMIRRKEGRVINISSVAGVLGNAGQANYAAAKAGMIGMTKALAREVANRGITINCVAPGFVETAMTEKLDDAQREALALTIPMRQFGTPKDIAAAVLYLASSEARYLTGQTLHVNGGMAMP